MEARKIVSIKKKPVLRIEKSRSDFKKLLIQNPNYFGTYPEVGINPVLPMKANTKYEELKCIGFYPDTDLLEAVIDLKLPYGYKGSLCSSGSFEYVRFFVDWNGDGDFEDEGEDVGITSVNVHDIPDAKHVCLDKTKPLSYALSLKIDSKKRVCTLPNLVKVRAILSWDAPPPEGKPNYTPVWGNVLDKWIQIKPIKFLLKDVLQVADLKKLKLNTSVLDLNIPISKPKILTTAELKQIYKGKDVPELRSNLAEIVQTATKIKYNPNLMVNYQLKPQFSKFMKDVKIVLAEKPNTKYEELHCTGLNYDLDTLVATLTVKRSCGYSGNLCTQGSYEYVAFWAYVWDQIEQMCIWRYLGTSSVNVHDIEPMPAGGLQYAVFLPVDLSSYKDKCSKPKILKIRAILSWQTPPPTNNPNYKPVWGNTIEKLIQLKPATPVMPGEQVPFISTVGGMAIASISGNPDTVTSSTIGDGYANGVSVLGGYTALESPFGGVISICGHISNPPDEPEEFEKLKYKVQFRKNGSTNWQDITNGFKIWISTWNGVSWSMSKKTQVAINGYYMYEEDLTTPVQRFVEGNVLAQLYTPLPDGDGLYEIRVLVFKVGAPPVPGVPANHVSSNIVKITIDNSRPTAEIFLDAGACTKFTVGDVITGYFTATDDHIDHYSLVVEPAVAVAPTVAPSGESYPLLSAPGMPSGSSFALTTTPSTTPCGYVLHLHVWDRAIKNNSRPGNYRGATVGLCLLEKTETP
uniref:Uncharacterized protein n=1 Tax=uncultured miscellaneous Crenarchaeota group TaxID=1368239 RepID=W8SHU3_9ARCH|nr:hypothetical protein MA2307 [uncultured miscellaneous Crenarchaeota group]